MSSHIYNCKRVTLATACQMLSIFKSLLKLGLSKKDAKGEACYQMEAGRQSPSHVRAVRKPTSRCKAHKMSKYVEGFDHAMIAAVGTVPKGQDLLKTRKAADTILCLFAQHRPDVYAKMMKAKINYKNVTGRNVQNLSKGLINNYYQEWLKIRRGKDLFIKGWGGFNIQKVAAKTSLGNSTVLELRSDGYEIEQQWSLKEVIEENPALVKWIAKYKDWFWCADKTLRFQRLARFDELHRFGRPDRDYGTSLEQTPEQFFAAVEALQDARENTVEGPETDYDWLEKVPDVETSVGIIKPIRSTALLVQAGKDLHQCAKSYNQRIIDQLSALLVCTDEMGKPLAMAEITDFDHEEGPILSQVSGVCNSPVSPEIEQAFLKCMEGMFSPAI